MKSSVLLMAAVAAFALAACKPADTPATDAPTTDAPTTETPATETTPAQPEAPAPTTDANSSASTSTGVPECDTYLEKVYACLNDKVPAAQRDMMKQGIEQSKSAWASVTDKAALGEQCKLAMEQAKPAYTAMGCSF